MHLPSLSISIGSGKVLAQRPSHSCLSSLSIYPSSVEKHHEHQTPPQLQSQYSTPMFTQDLANLVACLVDLADPKSNTLMLP
ncbi:hypothetical protein THAOC_00742 [Thalassiosira oceanica]|uniref:Uncharacterized protein n=1 Tax=Thalassiosira oceanica TaxID=159749 RepID=K0TIK4_THAOC|nr:hypothetical protein THAOC_00742 [Thalassiosira oceanica]|eukprot:EJK77430.1 hypothetical protein THAOC_00742 [Thalassiosira oceanica]